MTYYQWTPQPLNMVPSLVKVHDDSMFSTLKNLFWFKRTDDEHDTDMVYPQDFFKQFFLHNKDYFLRGTTMAELIRRCGEERRRRVK